MPAAGERCATPPPANEEEDDEASSSSSPDASYTSPTPRLRKQLQQCRTALSLAEGRTLASTRGAAQSKMDLEDMTRKQRCSQVHIAALRDEVRTAERDATDAAAARDEAHGKLGTSSVATRLALGRFRERLGQLEDDMAQRSARNQQHLQQLALLVAEIQHEVGGRGGPAAAPPRTRSLLRQMQQCLSFAAQDAALPAAAAWTHTAGDAIGSGRVQEVAATQASPPRRQASPPRRSRQASPPRRSGQASPQHRSKQTSPPLRSRSAPVSSPSRRHASPSARAKLLSRLSAEGRPQRPQRAAAAPTASQEDLAAATEDVVAATCLALGLPAPPLGATAPPGVAPSVARATAGTAAASASALAGAKAEAEAAAVSAAFAEEEVAAQRRKAEAAEEAGLRLAFELEAAQVQLREAGGQEARQEERAQEAEGLVGRYQQHIMRLQAAQAAREEEVGPRERRGCNPMRGRLRPCASRLQPYAHLQVASREAELRQQARQAEERAEAARGLGRAAQVEREEAIRVEMRAEMRLQLEAAAHDDAARRAAQREAEAAAERELRRMLDETCASLSAVQAQREEQVAERGALQAALEQARGRPRARIRLQAVCIRLQAVLCIRLQAVLFMRLQAVLFIRLQARGLARAREVEATETRWAAEEAGRGFEVAADELHRTVEQQRLQCNVLRQQMREALEQKQVLGG